MTRTIALLVVRLRDETGRDPTDQDLARLLAISTGRVAHHRRIIGGCV